jgi:hypothetical protein
MPFSPYDHGAVSRRVCERCGNSIAIQDLSDSVLKLDLSSRYLPKYFPDIRTTGVFHSRVVETLWREGCTGFRAYPMKWDCLEEWVERMTPKADDLQWPEYYRVEILGRVDEDLRDIDPDGTVFCPECHLLIPGARPKKSPRRRSIPVPGTWDGSDFCLWRGDSAGQSPLCSRRVVDIAVRDMWTNVAFGDPTPGVQLLSPVPKNWLELVEPKIREMHPDQFE